MTEQHDPDILYALVAKAAANHLHCADDVYRLIKEALPEHAAVIYEVAFRAKFIVRTRKILQRLPPRDDAREQLKQTFQNELERVKTDLLALMELSPGKEQFHEKYFSTTMESFNALMNILHDLSWIQNVKIDEENK
ncbi:MAG TPA: hypothetical protein VFA55_00855 [Candidatus Kapabacteria bacterium]|nr:hypothetical protein [Candidatus Kapabacteria bacterium]